MSIHALVIESQGKRIIVDTCIAREGSIEPAWSNLKLPFLSDLEKAGHARDNIDRVICTHLHVDHVGGTRCSRTASGSDVSNARY